MKITVETNVAAPIADVWRAFNDPDDILQWDASDDWYTALASNDLRVGGKLLLRIEARGGGGLGFDVAATYTQVVPSRLIECWMDDSRMVDRMVRVEFFETDTGVSVRQTFEAESTHPEGPQRSDWQAVLDRFARYVESIAEPDAAADGGA